MIQKQVETRNFLLNLVEGVLYISSSAFLSFQIVIPALVLRLGGGNVAVGAVPVIVYVGLFLPQIFAARYVESLPWKKGWAIAWGTVQRVTVLLMGIVVLTLAGKHPSTALGLFLGVYALLHVLAGMATPGWYDFFAKVTPLHRRGRLAGMRTGFGSLAAFFAGILLTLFLSSLRFPLNYAVGFFIAFLLQMASVITQIYIVEPEPSRVAEKRPISAYLLRLPEVFRGNREFRHFMVSAVILVIANMPVGFFTVYALKRFGAGEEAVGEFTLSMMAMMIVSALAGGWIADRYGNKKALMMAGVGMLLASSWALVAPTLGWFQLVFLFLGINVGTETMSRYNISAEYGPVEQRSTYVALMNTLLAPFYLSGLVGGWISDQFGYPALFAAGCCFSVAGLFLLFRWVRDPREIKLGGEGAVH